MGLNKNIVIISDRECFTSYFNKQIVNLLFCHPNEFVFVFVIVHWISGCPQASQPSRNSGSHETD